MPHFIYTLSETSLLLITASITARGDTRTRKQLGEKKDQERKEKEEKRRKEKPISECR